MKQRTVVAASHRADDAVDVLIPWVIGHARLIMGWRTTAADQVSVSSCVSPVVTEDRHL